MEALHKLDEQWAELGIDKKMHMYKAVEGCEGAPTCSGCYLLKHNGKCAIPLDSLNCPLQVSLDCVIKDLGILNEDECLAEAITGFYPRLSKHFIEGKFRWMLYAFTVDGNISITVWGDTLQEAKDAWNRRT